MSPFTRRCTAGGWLPAIVLVTVVASGGFKPVDFKHLAAPVVQQFERCFCKTFSRTANAAFLAAVRAAFHAAQWRTLLKMLHDAAQRAEDMLLPPATSPAAAADADADADAAGAMEDGAGGGRSSGAGGGDIPALKKRSGSKRLGEWKELAAEVQRLERQITGGKKTFAFAFIEGALVQALQSGDWVLLDELNLAPTETLERLAGLRDGADGSICLTERGDTHAVPRHPDFRLFGCMNPATDAGKKDLPPSLRTRFTEIAVREMEEEADLRQVVSDALRKCPAALEW